jgi:hypothetical protein
MLDRVLKHRAAPTKTVGGIERAIDLRSVSRPLLDLVDFFAPNKLCQAACVHGLEAAFD